MSINVDQIKNDIMAATSVADVEELRVSLLGKKGQLTLAMKELSGLDPEARKEAGKQLNEQKQEVAVAIDSKKAELELIEMNAQLEKDKIDLTLPVNQGKKSGTLHPITRAMMELSAIFANMGFEMAEGPDVEDDWHNFTALNIPEWHPARDMRDSFFIEGAETILRTETSAVQVRKMEKDGAPVRIFCPGRVYRVDLDATHAPIFHQCEGLVIGDSVTMAHLIGTLQSFLKSFFEVEQAPIRMRQHHFPFTEPSIEIDVDLGNGKWMEVLGAGMVNPKVLENCGVDSSKYQGFAFGMGIDRLAMLKYGIKDLRKMSDGDVRWLRHYGYAPVEMPSKTEGLS